MVSEFRRAEIVDAARTVFARRGFARGIIDEIAREAGMAKGTVYLYFRSKNEIFRAVLNHDMKALKKETLERIEEARDLKEKIAAFTLARIASAEARKDVFLIMDSESGGLALTRSQYHNWLREPVMRLAEAIEQAVEQGKVRPVPAEKTAWMIADMTRGTIQRRLIAKSETPPAEDSAFLSDFIWSALAAPRATLRAMKAGTELVAAQKRL
jgi:TetR/AcrR family transcriptional regulator of autoinduction and epiphytic fitness